MCNCYILFIIAQERNNDVTSVGHYIPYIKTGRKWLYYDDNSRKGTHTHTHRVSHLNFRIKISRKI